MENYQNQPISNIIKNVPSPLEGPYSNLQKCKVFCYVPQCKNVRNNSNKWFIHVPLDIKTRKKWFKKARRPYNVEHTTHLYACEDHFDIDNDIENYMALKLGYQKRIKLKPNVIPRYFDCQNRRFSNRPYERPCKRRRRNRELESAIENTTIQRLETYELPMNTDEYYAMFSKWHNIGDHLIKTKKIESSVEISLTNTKHLWKTVLSKEELITMAKFHNIVMEASDDRFLSATLELLCGDPSDVELKVLLGETLSYVNCSFIKSLQGFSFSLDVRLEQANLEQYYNEVTLPLLASIQEIQNQKEQLIKMIQAKDEEIGEYKLGGAKLFRKNIATKYFNKDEFLENALSSTNTTTPAEVFLPDVVLRDTLSNYHLISPKYDEKKEEDRIITIKTEPETIPSESIEFTTIKTESEITPSEFPLSTAKRKPPQPPVIPLAKRPKKGKLASLI